jgi:hypothetical protein
MLRLRPLPEGKYYSIIEAWLDDPGKVYQWRTFVSAQGHAVQIATRKGHGIVSVLTHDAATSAQKNLVDNLLADVKAGHSRITRVRISDWSKTKEATEAVDEALLVPADDMEAQQDASGYGLAVVGEDGFVFAPFLGTSEFADMGWLVRGDRAGAVRLQAHDEYGRALPFYLQSHSGQLTRGMTC